MGWTKCTDPDCPNCTFACDECGQPARRNERWMCDHCGKIGQCSLQAEPPFYMLPHHAITDAFGIDACSAECFKAVLAALPDDDAAVASFEGSWTEPGSA